jgi:hypothetical protein
MAAPFALLFIGVADILWGAWGDFVSKSTARFVALRLESGIAFLASSVVCYLFSERKKRKRSPLD